MFHFVQAATPEERTSNTPIGSLTTVELAGLVARLASLNAEVADAERITQLDFLERLKGAAAAAQARVSVELDSSQREVQARQGMPAEQLGRGVADQVALARRDSKVKGSRHLGLAKALVREMPHTMAALTAGEISEWRATIVARETAVLSADDRRSVDACLGPDLATLGDAQLAARAKSIGYALDPTSALRRARGAIADRRVIIRPAPDTMAYVTGFLPVAQGVAVHLALRQAAASARARGDQRSTGQIMADTFVERITGQATAEGVPLEVQLIMPAGTLLAGDDDPALIPGFGSVPAAFARDLVRGRAKAGEQDDGRDDAGAQGSGAQGSGAQGSGGPGIGGPGRSWPSGPRCGYAGCSPPRATAASSRWTRGVGPSTGCCAGSSSPATRSAAPRGAMPPSGTSTTSPRRRTTAKRPPSTVKASAPAATTPRSYQGGKRSSSRTQIAPVVRTAADIGSGRPRRPVTPTSPLHLRCWGTSPIRCGHDLRRTTENELGRHGRTTTRPQPALCQQPSRNSFGLRDATDLRPTCDRPSPMRALPHACWPP